MRTIQLIGIILLLGINTVFGQKLWSEQERVFLLEGLRKTKTELHKEVEGLNSEQMFFKPDTNSWSIAEVIEHLGVYEEYLYWDLFYGQYTPERADLVEKVKGNDEKFLEYATDKSKGSSPWIALPIGRFETKEELMNFFNRFRDEVIGYVEKTDCDFRLHFTYRAPGSGIWTERDLHQHTLIWIAHTERHTNQIRKIKEESNFPQRNK
jgi:hypothetical protein